MTTNTGAFQSENGTDRGTLAKVKQEERTRSLQDSQRDGRSIMVCPSYCENARACHEMTFPVKYEYIMAAKQVFVRACLDVHHAQLADCSKRH